MARASISLLTDPALHAAFAKAALERVARKFCAAHVVPQYESYYLEVTQGSPGLMR
jgi:hypothetical protein